MMADLIDSNVFRWAVLVIVFVTVVALVLMTVGVVSRNAAVRRRLSPATVPQHDGVAGPTLRGEAGNDRWSRLVRMIEGRGLSLVDSNEDKLRGRLIAAGYLSPLAPRVFTLLRLTLTLCLPAAVIVGFTLLPNPPSLVRFYVMGALLALLGLYGPNLFVSARAVRRREEILNGFPDALDLMLVCVEAGLGLEAALDRVGREMTQSHPLVSAMLARVVLELRAGRSRQDALRRMAEATAVPEVRTFSTLLIQSDRLGTSVGQTLRVYAAEMREKRRMRAEEKAHRLPVLLSVPLVACMLPTMIGVLMLPAAIRVVRQVLPILGGS